MGETGFRCKPWVSVENDVKPTECSNSIWAIRVKRIYESTTPPQQTKGTIGFPDGRGQFEEGFEDGLADWSIRGTPGGSARIDSSVSHTGRSSLRVEAKRKVDYWADLSSMIVFPGPGTRIRVSVYIKTAMTGPPNLPSNGASLKISEYATRGGGNQSYTRDR